MVQVQFFGLLRLQLKKERLELPAVDGETVSSLLHRAQRQLPDFFLGLLFGDDGRLQAGTVILVNRHNIHHLKELATPVGDGDVVAVFPPGAGG